jgi:hypothetical protein
LEDEKQESMISGEKEIVSRFSYLEVGNGLKENTETHFKLRMKGKMDKFIDK